MDLIPNETDVEAAETPTIFTSLDLELNQPSGKIIQIGAAVGHLMTGEIIEKFSCFIKIDEALDERIIKLTGATWSFTFKLGFSYDGRPPYYWCIYPYRCQHQSWSNSSHKWDPGCCIGRNHRHYIITNRCTVGWRPNTIHAGNFRHVFAAANIVDSHPAWCSTAAQGDRIEIGQCFCVAPDQFGVDAADVISGAALCLCQKNLVGAFLEHPVERPERVTKVCDEHLLSAGVGCALVA